METNNRKNLVILSLTLGVVMLGFGMVMPIMPFYIESMGASATELGLLVAISPFIQLVASPLWGAVSDRRGRKPDLGDAGTKGPCAGRTTTRKHLIPNASSKRFGRGVLHVRSC